MSNHDSKKGYILISNNIEAEFERLRNELKPNRVVGFIEDEFKIEHAKAVIAESYISESQVKYIILGANNFNHISQNSLLKLLEEPPRNIEYILISSTKSNLLPTVRSRMPILQTKTTYSVQEITLNLSRVNYAEVFEFLKINARVKKSEAKSLVEALYNRATVIDKLILNASQLQNFDKAYRLLELNSRPQSVLAMLIMSFVGEKSAN
ncbi:MAG: DNA polymerase III subunit delta' [Sulfurimonas sp. RIFOXYD12_FULL_33_39]|uniref:DNA polymerase III subunit delta' n=1 Tax=unclassified Sulfurimonas TaxID=2623549 RepID=UPI0008D6FFB0|nr:MULTISPECIES: DNA polymerase III subunit delta' [unclassified Sulfurimonas]OHE03144.1 MAG: DNA polymerase III subunit delta' [Sulfurimonas sp. RIFCSPLOWO2_12_FULL_34_6]OHE10557.1 MAG: DNA polymerase III subunit delta' [Sulfurimonas sp. RIFOXYD12_FULL_33_39]OHE15016.1 MAG: DNA polymerase III subunit delta' [Sulfurimonas sp. RIFOXYD2_FULL_34_21]